MSEELIKLLSRWYGLLCVSGCNTKEQVRQEIKEVIDRESKDE